MLGVNVWRRVLGVDRATVIEEIDLDEESETVVVHVRPRRATKRRCGRCGIRAPGYDQGEGRRNWRTLDLGTMQCFLQADSPRVNCPEHGPTVAQVPWARHGAGHTRFFDDQVAWLVTHTAKSTVCELMRIAWRTVGSIIDRVVADGRAAHDPFDGLTRIGIDEISYKKGHRYLTIVVDHDTGTAGVGGRRPRQEDAQRLLRPAGRRTRCEQIPWSAPTRPMDRRRWWPSGAPNATLCIDAFHVVAWATDALDEVRRQVWNEARKGGMSGHANELKGCRYALWRNPEDLTPRQAGKLAWIAKVNTKLYRAYLMKEQLRLAIRKKGVLALAMLDGWLDWAQRCRIPAFVELGRKIKKNIAGIEAAMLNNLSNALIESTNTKIRVLHRMAFGFAKPEHLIALALLDRGGYCPPLPGRQGA